MPDFFCVLVFLLTGGVKDFGREKMRSRIPYVLLVCQFKNVRWSMHLQCPIENTFDFSYSPFCLRSGLSFSRRGKFVGYRHLLGDIGFEVAGGVPLPPFLSRFLSFLFSVFLFLRLPPCRLKCLHAIVLLSHCCRTVWSA